MEQLRKFINYFSAYWILILYGSAMFVYFSYGRFPTLSNPKPANVLAGFDFLFLLNNCSGFIMIAAIILNFIFLIKMKKVNLVFRDASLIFFVVCFCCWVVNIFADPFGINAWFFD